MAKIFNSGTGTPATVTPATVTLATGTQQIILVAYFVQSHKKFLSSTSRPIGLWKIGGIQKHVNF